MGLLYLYFYLYCLTTEFQVTRYKISHRFHFPHEMKLFVFVISAEAFL